MSEVQSSPSSEGPLTVKILSSRFDRLNELQDLVTVRHDKVAELTADLKEAKKAHESARVSFENEVTRLLKHVKGVDDLPLFANMNDAIDKATSDPTVDRLMRRLLEHHFDNVNILIVAGYTEAERNELTTYLDALDVRAAALAQVEAGNLEVAVPAVPDMPAFIAPQEVEVQTAGQTPSDDSILEALQHVDVTMTGDEVARLTLQQRYTLLTWVARVKHIKAEKGEALVFDDLPPVPDFIATRDLIAAADATQDAAAPSVDDAEMDEDDADEDEDGDDEDGGS